MYARTTTVHADARRIDDGIRHVRDEILPAVGTLDDCLGLSMLCDRRSGRCIVTTSWRSVEGRGVVRDRVTAMWDRLGAILGGRTDVHDWEIGLVHRTSAAPDGACARVTWTRGDPAGLDDVLGSFCSDVVPRLDGLPGFCSTSLLVDRGSGLSALTSVYADQASIAAARDDVRALREEFTERLGLEVVDVAETEVAVHHLRVPELA